ncbi:MAG: hypothetical protein FJZ43_02520 [Candidatus Staskawiczbacteria bacterium]|nr:hypothetical protein [Candidatus Staskawiczbacteria bacterium]
MLSAINIETINAIYEKPSLLIIIMALSMWSLIWKGFALWKASRNSQRNWFVAMLILNTLGILEIIYIFYLQKKDKKEITPKE